MGVKDYYKILGVSENASQDEIKQAFRRLAKMYHPDANPGNKEAEEKFKDIQEAHEILSNPQKREKYDQMRKFGTGANFDFNNFNFGGFHRKGCQGGGGFSFEGFDIFSDLGDVFSQIFDIGQRTRKSRRGPTKGDDIRVNLTIPFELAINGGKTSFSVEKEKVCPVCSGGGAKPGSRVETCPECNGRGTVVIGYGGFGVSRPCPRCYGRGHIIHNPCDRCHGRGVAKGKRTYSVKIPKGIDEMEEIRLRGEGEPGIGGAPPGDMIVRIHVQPHHFFKREGNDITCEIYLDKDQAARGATVKVKTVHGSKIKLKIPPGTHDGSTFRLSGMGIKRNGREGDQYITVRVKE